MGRNSAGLELKLKILAWMLRRVNREVVELEALFD